MARHHLTVGFAALALLISVFLGAMHALAPGHGKTLMAATAAARGGKAGLRDVMPLAASVTVTHTLGVVALGLLVTAGSAAAPSVIAWLGIASGVLVTFAGATLVRRAWRNRPRRPGLEHAHDHSHGHAHDHAHDHHAHSHADGDEHEHERGHEHAEERERPLVLAHAPASAATTAAAAADSKPHTRGHERGHPHDHDHAHDHHHDHAHPHPHAHEPAAPPPSNTPTAASPTPMRWPPPSADDPARIRRAASVPSPSAVVVLVGAAALGQAWFGLLLVLAYGVGLALTLTAAGFAVVKLGDGMNRALAKRSRWAGGPTAALIRRTAPLGSALIVVALGAGLVFRGRHPHSAELLLGEIARRDIVKRHHADAQRIRMGDTRVRRAGQ